MPDFYPPLPQRSNEELIEIANSTSDNWQQEAIDQARTVLLARKVSRAEQDEVLRKWKKEADEFLKLEARRLESNKTESYKAWEIAVLFFFGPVLLMRPYLFNSHTLFTLRGENYFLKFRQRIIIFSFSLLAWFFYINYSYEKSEQLRLEEINAIDISDWKKEHGSK